MRINAQSMCVNKNNGVTANKNICYAGYSVGLKKDTFTPSFTALKKSMFKGIDFAVVEKFKSPIEKFNSLEDFYKWAEDECYKICMKDYGGRTGEVKYKRDSMICDWDNALSSGEYSDSERLLILDAVVKGLKPNNDSICPVYNRNVLNKTLDGLKSSLEKDKNFQFSFNKIYKKNLIDMYTKNSSIGQNDSKWIIIPSKDNDPVNFKENVKKLQSISTNEMCTKYTGAEFHLENGDIHVYMENGKPKVLLRLNDGVVQEINGEHNDYRIPKECVELTKKYLYEQDLITTEKADEMLRKSERDVISEPINNITNNTYNSDSKSIFKKLLNLFK